MTTPTAPTDYATRFKVCWWNPRGKLGGARGYVLRPGYVVLDRTRRITVPTPSRALAEQRAKNLARIYERYDW
jgi:hypothetical protein